MSVSSRPFTRNSNALQGFLLMAIAMLLLPGLDTIAKILSQDITPLQVTWGRFFFQAFVMMPLVIVLNGWAALWPKRLWGNVVRGALIAFASLFFFSALKFMPLADTLAIFFIEPMILTLLSAVVLKEQVGWRRGLAVVAGFVGAVIVIEPSFEEVGFVALFPVAAAFCFACYLILTRRLTPYDGALTMQFVAGVVGCLVLSLLLIGGALTDLPDLAFSTGDVRIWSLLFAIGCLAAIGHLMVVSALQRVPASALASLQYLEIVSATALGYWVFGDFPTSKSWIGITIIVCAGLFVAWREARLAQET